MTGLRESSSGRDRERSRSSPSKSRNRSPKRDTSSRKLTRGNSYRRSKTSSLSFSSYDFIPKHSVRRSFEKHYRLGQLLGEGGFGAAYIATHIATGAERAVKVLPKSDEEAMQEAYQEFRMMAKMDHPNIAKTHELYEDDKSFYIVQDLYRGGDLFDLVEKGTLSEYQTAMVASSLLMSIGFFHKKNLCHRDLKPENILLEETNVFHSARIIDFGLARYTEQGKKFTDILGSLEYVSPQVLKGSYGKACDIWSVGVIAFVLLAGRTPFDGDDDHQIMAAIKKGSYEFSDPIWENVSDECKDFIEQLLSYEEGDRPPAAKALQHRWLQRMRKQHQKANHDEIQTDIQKAVDALERFRSRKSKLKQATCVLLAAQFLEKKDREHIDQVFRVLDRRCVGSLNADDLHFAFWFTDITGETRSDEYIERIVKEVNFSKTGSISYSEFAAVMMLEMKMVDEQRLENVFDYYAKSKPDIDWADLEQVLYPGASNDKHEQDCRKIVAEATNDRSKIVTFRDFKRIMLSDNSNKEDDSSSRRSHRDPHQRQ